MSKFRYCPNPNCQSTREDANVYECESCGFKGCYKGYDINPVTFFLGGEGEGCWKVDNCPRCRTHNNYQKLGYITKNA